jgi:XdhC/CoxI family protein
LKPSTARPLPATRINAEAIMVKTVCVPGSDLGTGEPEWLPGGQDLRDVALQLRLMLNSGTSFAIATVVGAHGTALRRPGTVVVISQSGETIGVNPAGPLDRTITDLAAKALTTGQDQLERLDIDHEAASYIDRSRVSWSSRADSHRSALDILRHWRSPRALSTPGSARRSATDPRPLLYAHRRQILVGRRSFRVSWC